MNKELDVKLTQPIYIDDNTVKVQCVIGGVLQDAYFILKYINGEGWKLVK